MSYGKRLWVAYHAQRTLMTFRGLVRLTLVVRRCRNQECDLYHLLYRAEEEAWALAWQWLARQLFWRHKKASLH
jgi:hypothetical protein